VSTDFGKHIPEAILDEFVMEMLCEQDCAHWEEHLLVCNICQDRLVEADEYVRVVKAAAAAIANPLSDQELPPSAEFGERRALAKPMMAATHAALLLASVLGSHFMFLPR